jgi:hypothetical protein
LPDELNPKELKMNLVNINNTQLDFEQILLELFNHTRNQDVGGEFSISCRASGNLGSSELKFIYEVSLGSWDCRGEMIGSNLTRTYEIALKRLKENKAEAPRLINVSRGSVVSAKA